MARWFAGLVAIVASTSWASPVLEYIDPETGARVFDATGDAVDFDAPTAPREFADFAEYLDWLVKRFEATPIRNDNGDLIDVQGAWVLYGRPSYKFEGQVIVVRDPVVQTIAGPFGYVLIGGVRFEMPIDAPLPPISEIEPALFSLTSTRLSCASGLPLVPSNGHCVVLGGFKHIYIPYQSIGGTVDLTGAALVTPGTFVSLVVRFMDAFGRPLPISTPTTTRGTARSSRSNVRGIGIAEWGVFGNPFIDPTKVLRVDGLANGPVTPTGDGQSAGTLFQRY